MKRKKGGKEECQLLRGHQFKLVSGQGKWQQWMPKLERSQSDLRKPCYPQHASVPGSKEHGSRSHPDKVWSRRVGRALLRGGFSKPPKPQDTREDRGRESIDHSWGRSLCVVRHAPGEVPTMCSNEHLQVYAEMLRGALFSLEGPILLSHSNSFNPTMNSTGVRLYYYQQFNIMVPKISFQ